jgi:cation transport ATPase
VQRGHTDRAKRLDDDAGSPLLVTMIRRHIHSTKGIVEDEHADTRLGNDAPALVTADVGIAIGAGTDVAVEAGDIVLVRSDPRDVPRIIALSKATYRKMVQNLWWAAGYNIVAIPLAAGVLAPWGIVLPAAVGAVLMSLSTVIVAINAQLLRGARLT